MFLAVGALASQLAATRRQASAYAGAALGVSYALRMVADSGTGLDWLRWVSPLGWVEQLQPLTAPHPFALLPIAGLVWRAELVHRSPGGGARPRSEARSLTVRARLPHTRLCSGPAGLDIRLMRSTLVGWGVAIAAYGLLLGLVAKVGRERDLELVEHDAGALTPRSDRR